MDKTEKYLASIDRSLKVIAKALSEQPTVSKDDPTKRKPPDRKYK